MPTYQNTAPETTYIAYTIGDERGNLQTETGSPWTTTLTINAPPSFVSSFTFSVSENLVIFSKTN